MTDLVKTVQNTIKEHALIAPGDLVILGFSGGPDILDFPDSLDIPGSYRSISNFGMLICEK